MFGYVAGLPAFLSYFAFGLLAYAVFAGIYTRLTPHDEMRLIRSGNLSATIAFLGALAGFGLPMASAAANSVNIIDFIIWSIIGIVVQILAFYVARASLPGIHEKIGRGEVSAGVWGGGIAFIIGILNAACMTY
ncbi:DUF350 domain-containing protein [Rhizobium sp. Root564]|uniref:DUF350 domain-containing protein n=1 Tax=Agrobacterium cavarae TaxID=2528239 RepID=UPI0007132F32|nr:hypothetical protein ASD74_10360 [Rhizobium sp. Root564]